MQRLHLAISTDRIDDTIKDYSQRFGMPPCTVVDGEYALWRTESLNISIRRDSSMATGTLRHLGWEDDDAEAFSSQRDVNGIVWERFTAWQQADEINASWPGTDYRPE